MKPKIKTLKNGLRIVTVPMQGNPTVTVLVMVEAGTRYETRDNNGLSHFLEHMCFKGTVKRTNREIAYELESMGAVTNAFTSYDYTGYYTKGRAALFPKLLDVVSDVYLNSTFPESEIEKERGVICGEIDMYEDMPQAKVQYLGLASIYGEQPAGYTIVGPKENIQKFTRKDFLNYHKKHYIAEKTVVVVVGDIDTASVEKQVATAFAAIPTGSVIKKKAIKKQSGIKVVESDKKTDQSHLYLGMRTLPMGHPDEVAVEVLVGILGKGMSSRLFLRLREEMGAGYYVGADTMNTDDTGIFEVSVGTAPQRVAEVVAAIREEIEKMRTVPVGDGELQKIKQFMTSVLYMSTESSHRIAEMVATQAILHQPIKTPADIEKAIRKVSAADVLRVAKKYLNPKYLHLALIGPGGNIKELENILS